MRFFERRKFIQTLSAVAACAALPCSTKVFAQRAQAIRTEPLRANLLLLTGAGANVVALVDESVALVDGGLAAHSSELLHAVAAESRNAPISTLFNTHWHPEQTGSNEALGARGAKIVAHENTKLWLGTQIVRPTENFVHAALPAAALPNDTFYSSGESTIGKTRVEYRHLPQAHTDGDIYVRFPDANVVAVGDLVAVQRYPTLDYITGGFVAGLLQATKTLLEIADDDTLIVPAQGPVQTRAHLQLQFDMLSAVFQNMLAMVRKGFSAADMVANGVTAGFDEEWGAPDRFVAEAYQGLWAHVRELRGIV